MSEQHDTTNRPRPIVVVGELRCGSTTIPVHGRALRLAFWLATHQDRLNMSSDKSGQLWLTWKGDGPDDIEGDIRFRL